jgi:hypothetical protein
VGPEDEAVTVTRGRIEDAASADFGEPAVVVYSTFTNPDARELSPGSGADIDEQPAARWTVAAQGQELAYQLTIVAVRRSGRVHDLWLRTLDREPAHPQDRPVLHLRGDEAARFVALLGNRSFIALAAEHLPDPGAPAAVTGTPELEAAYGRDPQLIRQLIETDVEASDVVAVAHRRKALTEFRTLLEDADYFAARVKADQGSEKVWQGFFEAHPWLLGGSLAGGMYAAWDPERLEQVAIGRSMAGPGKRPDAVLRSLGVVRSMAFVELKHHRTPLLSSSPYRPGAWSVSTELAGAVAQAQVTAQLVAEALAGRLPDVDAQGFDVPGDFTYLVRPRSFVVAGHLDQLTGPSGGDDQARIRSFELFRRSLSAPEVLTFDEVLARAEALLDRAVEPG